MKKILILDDDSIRHKAFGEVLTLNELVHVWTTEEFTDAFLNKGPFDLIFLDHDLNDFGVKSTTEGYGGRVELTGADVAAWLAKQPLRPQVIIHSWNPGGAMNMLNILRDAGFSVTYQPFNGDVSKTEVVESNHIEPVEE